VPLVVNISSSILVVVFAALFAQVECKERPQPLHAHNGSATPLEFFESLPEHSTHMANKPTAAVTVAAVYNKKKKRNS
jgi:hypothetical protein